MLEKIIEYRKAKAVSDIMDRSYLEAPEDIDIERRWNEAYAYYIESLRNLVNEIVNITDGKIDSKTARIMVVNYLDEIESIVRRYGRGRS